MNKFALVLAADSATTVSTFVQGKRQTRYFKGANKLFQLSNSHPVGLMINGSASLQDVPWELIVKEFRKCHGEEGATKLADYGRRFFDFVKGHAVLFSEDAKRAAFYDKAEQAAFSKFGGVLKLDEVKGADRTDRTLFATIVGTHLQVVLDTLKVTKPSDPITDSDVDAAVAAHAPDFTTVLTKSAKALFDADFEDSNGAMLAEIGIRELLCRYKSYLTSSGVVLGGYGEEEFFPSFEVFDCFGFLDRHFIANREDSSAAIGNDRPAVIEPFATASMINTFRMGVGPDIFTEIIRATGKALKELAETVRTSLDPQSQIKDIDAILEKAQESCTDDWAASIRTKHFWPFIRVVASLPIPDMAAVAKSLVELESLKERVTDSSESVGGPIDVAAITKHDGFVWIERKHYFRPELNPRFFIRQRVSSRSTT